MLSLRYLFILGFLCTARIMAYSTDSTSIKNTRLLTQKVKQYEKAEWDITLSAHYNPDTGKYSHETYTVTKDGEIEIPGLTLATMASSILIFSSTGR